MHKNKIKILAGLFAVGVSASTVTLAATQLMLDQDNEYQTVFCTASDYAPGETAEGATTVTGGDTVSLGTHNIKAMGFAPSAGHANGGFITLPARQINTYFFQVQKIPANSADKKRYGHRFKEGYIEYSMTGSGTLNCAAQNNAPVAGRNWYPSDKSENPNSGFWFTTEE